ncbi:hypothetical protein [Bradyrhizobium betae]|uniref:Uncharacterized protein n=1 Tax=Bradyrhizobium betae TaxID=244734 RepID=A0A5P6NZI1_9BRAD|nr:hypothetical protein [Bradyrhizobium betae]MCS3725482.1 hypothetical protein [Bradyrhizobium betae]QFI71228.1 hypothetical protein F8237_01860 [Bradyrhizobium betae]
MTEQSRFHPWTPIDIRRAAMIWQRDFADHHGESDGPWGAQGEVFATIAHAIGKTVDGVAARFLRFGASFSAGPRGGGPTEQAQADFERRSAARDRQDLTARVFGDPPPGYSALDKRRAGVRP